MITLPKYTNPSPNPDQSLTPRVRGTFTQARNAFFRVLESELEGTGESIFFTFERDYFASTYSKHSPYFSEWNSLPDSERTRRMVSYYLKVRGGYESAGLPLPWTESEGGTPDGD